MLKRILLKNHAVNLAFLMGFLVHSSTALANDEGNTSAIKTLAAANAESASASIKAGKAVYARCQGCHSLNRNRKGPKHCGLIGRKAGSVKGYKYSEAMRTSGIVWDAPSLNRFLSSPAKMVPGTKMRFGGVKDEQDRKSLIAYFEHLSESHSEECRKSAD